MINVIIALIILLTGYPEPITPTPYVSSAPTNVRFMITPTSTTISWIQTSDNKNGVIYRIRNDNMSAIQFISTQKGENRVTLMGNPDVPLGLHENGDCYYIVEDKDYGPYCPKAKIIHMPFIGG